MITHRSFLTAGLFVAAVASSFASDVTGAWYGHLDFTTMKTPPGANAATMQKTKAMFAKFHIDLVMKKDKSYTVTVSGFGQKPQTETGTWSQKGATITMTDKTKKGQDMTVSKDGKTLSMSPPGANGSKIVFVRTKPKA